MEIIEQTAPPRVGEDLARNGFVVIDKPAGPTSHDVVEAVASILGVTRAGHTGTLDPDVTGVLPVLLENATPLVKLLIGRPKEYLARAETDADVEPGRFREHLEGLVGEIVQTPPPEARVKRVPRRRQVYELELLEEGQRHVVFRTLVEGGTYIRTICEDMGGALGCEATMAGLRRTRAAQFLLADAIALDRLREVTVEAVRPMEGLLGGLGKIRMDAGAVGPITNGSPLYLPGVTGVTKGITEGETIALIDPAGRLVALGEAAATTEEIAAGGGGVAAQPRRIIGRREER